MNSRAGPLSFFRKELLKQGFHHIWMELEAKASDLFIEEAGHCKLEVINLILQSQHSAALSESNNEPGASTDTQLASTVEELSIALAVRTSSPMSRTLM